MAPSPTLALTAVLLVLVAVANGQTTTTTPYVGLVSGITSTNPFTPGPVQVPTFPALTVSVMGFGAKGDGTTNDAAAINKAIANVSASGGGSIQFPSGRYLSTSIHLASNIRLVLDSGSEIY